MAAAGFAPIDYPRLPVIGRLLLGSGAFSDAYGYLEEQARTLIKAPLFLPYIGEKYYRRHDANTDAHSILDIFSKLPAMSPIFMEKSVTCEILDIAAKNVSSSNDHRRNDHTKRLDLLGVEQDPANYSLQVERAMLYREIGYTNPPMVDTPRFRLPLVTIDSDRSGNGLVMNVLPLLPKVLTFGPLQVIPAPASTQ